MYSSQLSPYVASSGTPKGEGSRRLHSGEAVGSGGEGSHDGASEVEGLARAIGQESKHLQEGDGDHNKAVSGL